MRVFAIGDLHLPSLRNKPMDRFGWLGHPGPLGEAWDKAVGPEVSVGDYERVAPLLHRVLDTPQELDVHQVLNGSTSW